MFHDHNLPSPGQNIAFGIWVGGLLALVLIVSIADASMHFILAALGLGVCFGAGLGLLRTMRELDTRLVFRGPVAVSVESGWVEVCTTRGARFRVEVSDSVRRQLASGSAMGPAEAIVIKKKKDCGDQLHSIRIPGLGNLPLHGQFFEPDFALNCACGCRQHVLDVISIAPFDEGDTKLIQAQFLWQCPACKTTEQQSHYATTTKQHFHLFAEANKRK